MVSNQENVDLAQFDRHLDEIKRVKFREFLKRYKPRIIL